MSEAFDRYQSALNDARSLGYTLTIRALRDLYGDAGEVIYELQREIDQLRARDKKRGGE